MVRRIMYHTASFILGASLTLVLLVGLRYVGPMTANIMDAVTPVDTQSSIQPASDVSFAYSGNTILLSTSRDFLYAAGDTMHFHFLYNPLQDNIISQLSIITDYTASYTIQGGDLHVLLTNLPAQLMAGNTFFVLSFSGGIDHSMMPLLQSVEWSSTAYSTLKPLIITNQGINHDKHY